VVVVTRDLSCSEKVKLPALLTSKVRLKCYISCTPWVNVTRSWTTSF